MRDHSDLRRDGGKQISSRKKKERRFQYSLDERITRRESIENRHRTKLETRRGDELKSALLPFLSLLDSTRRLTCPTSKASGDPRTRSSISSAWKSERAFPGEEKRKFSPAFLDATRSHSIRSSPSQTESQPRWKALNWRETESTRRNWTRRSTYSKRVEGREESQRPERVRKKREQRTGRCCSPSRFFAVTGISAPPGIKGTLMISP